MIRRRWLDELLLMMHEAATSSVGASFGIRLACLPSLYFHSLITSIENADNIIVMLMR